MGGLSGRTARSKRLVELYNLRAKVNSEIAQVEAQIRSDVRTIRAQWRADDPHPKPRKIAECGTDGGYHHHRRIKKEAACTACLSAHSAAERGRKLRRSAC